MSAEPGLLIELAIKSTLVLGGVFAVMRLARRLAAEERHVVWAIALASLLLLPVLALSGPQLRMPIGKLFASAVETFVAQADPAPSEAEQTRIRDASGGKEKTPRTTSGSEAQRAETPNGRTTSAVANTNGLAQPAANAWPAWRAALLTLYSSASTLYLGVCGLLLAYFAAAALRVAVSLRRLPDLSDPRLLAMLEAARERQSVRRSVRLKVSAADVTPWAWGVLRPVVVVPRDFSKLTAEAQRDALVHELAHIARLDFVTTLLACGICALYWLQPLAWLAFRRMARETEQACDDRVLLSGGTQTSYAAQLLETAQAIRRVHRPMAATAMAGSSAVSTRIASILDANIRRKAVNARYVALVSILTVAVLLPVASLKSQEAATAIPADPDDAAFLALVQRGPANDDELSLIVNTYVTHGRQTDAVDVLAGYIARDVQPPAELPEWLPGPGDPCRFCADVLGGKGSTPDEGANAAPAVVAAFDEVESRARQANDGNLLIRLASICVASENTSVIGKGTYYLLEGFRLGRLTSESNLMAVSFLEHRGWDTEAKELAQRLYDDASSSLYQTKVLKTTIRRLNTAISQRDSITKRLLTPNATITYKDSGDVIPLYRQPPVYPPSALKEHLEGMAQIQFTVTKEGKTQGATVVDATNDEFGRSAVEAVSHWLYLSDVVDGVPVERPGVHTIIRFVLAD
jgi:TonB family protein